MIKTSIAAIGLIGLFTGSYYGSTKLGLRTEGWQNVRFEVADKPSFAAVGQYLYDSDGTKFMVSAICPNKTGDHVIEARVRVTNRLALNLFPTRMEKSYAMNKKAIERAVLQAAGVDTGHFEPSEKEWIAVDRES
ncbi:hypothetical protein OJ996_13390 [Luteolibacter sp. GHJ8]|uniref:Uncharacterized protein n=1 Tax=Luteolibacter rhizosphaerae TaxID=2989719 RepID=A0ABT3G402_9BACT|nr:hypothetical protein [Luteolibacter rhizosphaerae]MCW1914577.1 hypothetical protein [Luteolibacter rhizosphaerae]